MDRRSFLTQAARLAVPAVVILAPGRAAWAKGFPGGASEALGPNFTHRGPRGRRRRAGATTWIHHWNQVAIDASGLDHTQPEEGENRIFGEALGPGRSSRAIAIAHIAIFEAVNAIAGGYKSYCGLGQVSGDVSLKAAIAQAACDSLSAVFPSQKAAFDEELVADLNAIDDRRARTRGIALGRRAAAAILALRADDGADHPEPRVGVDHITSDEPGHWRQDPISLIPLAMGAHWGEVTPFVLQSPGQFRVPPPPALDSEEYAAAYAEVKRLGGEGGTSTPTERTVEQTQIGIYWAYDGTPSLCAPPRLYNQIAVLIADQMRSNLVELSRLLALINVAMADAGIAIWESKYHYDFWRPITGIREGDERGPTGLGDGNPATEGDPEFRPLGAPGSNSLAPNFTPPFPAYPSGHAGFGGALFQILRRFYGTDRIRFTFVSDEYNGETLDNTGAVRPLLPRTFSSLSEAEEENGQSRIYLGIHWAFDKTQGIAQGRRVADYVFRNAFTPLRGRAGRG
jgi:hypothetical protein